MGALVLSLALLLIRVEGGGSCPSAGEVSRQLVPLLRPSPPSSVGHIAILSEEVDGTLSISLGESDGRTVARRRLPRAGSCAEQAAAAAVALAVWETEIRPQVALHLEQLPAGPSRESDLTLTASPPPIGTLLPAVGAAAVVSRQAGSTGAGGRVDATLATVGRRFRPRLSLAGIGQHTVDVGLGQADWWRLYIGIGGDYVLPLRGRWQAAVGASALLGGFFVAGDGFPANSASQSADLGTEALARLELGLGAVRPWLGVALTAWAQRRILDAPGEGKAVLPRLEPQVVVGADFCWRQ